MLRLWLSFLVVVTMPMAMEKNDGDDPGKEGCVAATFSGPESQP